MGKRKRSQIVYHSSPSDSLPCSSGRDLTPGENSSDPGDNSIFRPQSSLKEIMDNRGKPQHSQLSVGQHHHHNMSRSMFLKRSRQHYGNQYSRRNSPNNHKPSTYGKGGPPHDDRLCFKLGSKNNSVLGHRSDRTDSREKTFVHPERISSTSNSLVIHAVSPEGMRMVCALCQNPLRQNRLSFERILLASESEELSVVAVLVCGHKFHANCLECRTRLEDKTDPPCPVCKVMN